MEIRFYNFFLISSSFVLFLFSLIFIPQVYAKRGAVVNDKESKNNEKRDELKIIRSEDGRFIDNRDGTITDKKTNLIWAKKDSYAELGKCLNWNKSREYVIRLQTGGYNDWRMPTVKELKSILEKSKSNIDKDNNIMHMDPIFAPGTGYWQWSSEEVGPCCARFVLFSNGDVLEYTRECFFTGGVRAVRRGN